MTRTWTRGGRVNDRQRTHLRPRHPVARPQRPMPRLLGAMARMPVRDPGISGRFHRKGTDAMTVKSDTLASAMASAFAEIEAATKSANNPHFKSKYADLGAVIDAIKPALIKHGLFYM